MLRKDSDVATPKGSFIDSDKSNEAIKVNETVKLSKSLHAVNSYAVDVDKTPLITDLGHGKRMIKSKLSPEKPPKKPQTSPQKLIKLMQLAN